jgi:hypothetical protein
LVDDQLSMLALPEVTVEGFAPMETVGGLAAMVVTEAATE